MSMLCQCCCVLEDIWISNDVSVLLLYCVWKYVTIHVQHWYRARLNSFEIKTHTMMLPITMHKRNILLLIKIMTTVEAIHICTVAKDTMQIWRCRGNADDEIRHGNVTTYVHLGATYITEYHKGCGRWRWQARWSENGWYSKWKVKGMYDIVILSKACALNRKWQSTLYYIVKVHKII